MRQAPFIIGSVIAAACGTRAPAVVQLPTTTGAPVSPKAPTTACSEQWSACRAVAAPVRVSGTSTGQNPEIAWDGHEALVTFDTPGQGIHLAAVTIDGRVLWMESLAGVNAHVAWNPRTQTGLVVTSESIVWLGRDGKPIHTTSAPHVTNVTFRGAAFAIGDGFLVATGVGGHVTGTTPTAFSVATIGAPTDAIAWKRIADDGLRGAPVGGPPELVTWMVSAPQQAAAQLFSVSSTGELGAPITLPSVLASRVAAVADDHKQPLVVLVEDATHELTLVASHDGVVAPPVKLGVRSTRSGSAVLLRIAGRLVLGADKIGDSPGVALAPLDAAALPPVTAPLAIGPENSQHLRAAATDRGFVAAWNIADDAAPLISLASHAPMHGLSTMLAVYTCCPAHE
jgi:hypothetical protein